MTKYKQVHLDIDDNISKRDTVRRCVICQKYRNEFQFGERDATGRFVSRNICRDCWNKSKQEADVVEKRKIER